MKHVIIKELNKILKHLDKINEIRKTIDDNDFSENKEELREAIGYTTDYVWIYYQNLRKIIVKSEENINKIL